MIIFLLIMLILSVLGLAWEVQQIKKILEEKL